MRQTLATDLPRLNTAFKREKLAPVDPAAKTAEPAPVTPPRP